MEPGDDLRESVNDLTMAFAVPMKCMRKVTLIRNPNLLGALDKSFCWLYMQIATGSKRMKITRKVVKSDDHDDDDDGDDGDDHDDGDDVLRQRAEAPSSCLL